MLKMYQKVYVKNYEDQEGKIVFIDGAEGVPNRMITVEFKKPVFIKNHETYLICVNENEIC